MAKRGLREGRTREANWVGVRMREIRKMLGKREGRSCVSFICVRKSKSQEH